MSKFYKTITLKTEISKSFTAVTKFFTIDEISSGKEILNEIARKTTLQGLPVHVTRKGAGRHKADTENLYTLYEFFDVAKFNLPEFMVKDLRRIPFVSPNEFDVGAVLAGLDKLRIQMEVMEVKLNLLERKINAGCQSGVCPSLVCLPGQLDATEGKVKEAKLADISQSGIAPTMATSSTQFSSSSSSSLDQTKVLWSAIMSQPPTQIQPIQRKVLGTGNSTSKLTLASKDKLWHVFLGRLDKETLEIDITEHLEASRIKMSKVFQLLPQKD